MKRPYDDWIGKQVRLELKTGKGVVGNLLAVGVDWLKLHVTNGQERIYYTHSVSSVTPV